MRKHKFLNIRGFSLVEVMVVGGILTIIGLGVMSLISNTTKSQRGLQAKDTMRDFAVEIRSTLSDKTACINTFATKNLSTDEATVTVVKDASNNAKYSAGTTYMNGLINFKNLVMREFVADAANPNTGIAKLFVYADKNGDTSGVKTIHHVLSAQIEMDASKNILKCIAVGGLSDSLWQVSTANPNDIFFNGGKVGIGTTTPSAIVSAVTESASSILPGFSTTYYSDSNAWANGFNGARARGTLAAPTALQTNDRFLSFIGAAYSGSYFHNSAAIQFVATENHSATGQGAAISFETIENGHPTAAGVTTRFERMRIDHSGKVGIGTTSPVSKLDINANLQNPVLSLRTAGANNTTQSVINLHSKDDGNLLGTSANNLGWTVYARGNTYTYGGDTPNKFGISYWDGANWHTPYFNIMPDGNVGIGVMNPTVAKLQVEVPVSGSPHIGVLVENKDATVGAASFRLNRNDTSVQNNIVWYTATSVPAYQWAVGQISAGTNNLEVTRNGLSPLQVWEFTTGNVGINTTTPGYKLDVQGGDINASGSVRAAGVALTSDERFKKDIKTLDFSLEKILSIRGVEYNWRQNEFPERHFNDRHQIGVIAQEVEKVYPEIVDTNKDGYKSVNYPALVAPLIEAVKSLYSKFLGHDEQLAAQARQIANVEASKADKAETDAKVQQLESENQKLKQENSAIKAYLCSKAPSAPICK